MRRPKHIIKKYDKFKDRQRKLYIYIYTCSKVRYVGWSLGDRGFEEGAEMGETGGLNSVKSMILWWNNCSSVMLPIILVFLPNEGKIQSCQQAYNYHTVEYRIKCMRTAWRGNASGKRCIILFYFLVESNVQTSNDAIHSLFLSKLLRKRPLRKRQNFQ
jgi:hypothetical protein